MKILLNSLILCSKFLNGQAFVWREDIIYYCLYFLFSKWLSLPFPYINSAFIIYKNFFFNQTEKKYLHNGDHDMTRYHYLFIILSPNQRLQKSLSTFIVSLFASLSSPIHHFSQGTFHTPIHPFHSFNFIASISFSDR